MHQQTSTFLLYNVTTTFEIERMEYDASSPFFAHTLSLEENNVWMMMIMIMIMMMIRSRSRFQENNVCMCILS